MDLFITADEIGHVSGGGAVAHYESAALASMGPIVWLDRRKISPDRVAMPENAFAYDTMAAAQLLDLHDKYQFQLAHFYSGTFPLVIDELKKRGTKVSYTVAAHDPKLSLEEQERTGMVYQLPHLTDPYLRRLYTECHRQSDLVICPSKRSAEIMRREFGCQTIRVINHGIAEIDVPFVSYPSDFRVGYLGQAGPDKGLMYLFAATKMSGHQLVMAGRHASTMFDMWRSYGGGKVVIKGFVDSPSDLYNDCSVYCQPSVTEAWGIEVLEAMAHGRPVICSEGAGAAEAISDGVDGYVVPIRRPDLIADRLERLRKDPALLADMGHKAIQKAKRYGWAEIQRQYVETWKALRASTL